MGIEVVEIDALESSSWQLTKTEEFECNLKIVILSVDFEEKEDTLRRLQAILVGPYLAYTREMD